MTTYGKDGQPQLRKRILVDCGANVLCINMDVATDCSLHMVSCITHIKIFGDNKASVIVKILNYPMVMTMTFCKGTKWEVTTYFIALVKLQVLLGRLWPASQWSTTTLSTCGPVHSWAAWSCFHGWQVQTTSRSSAFNQASSASTWGPWWFCQLP